MTDATQQQDSDAGLRACADELAIRATLTRYLSGLDRTDYELAMSSFAPDANAVFSDVHELVGRDAITEFLGGGVGARAAGLKVPRVKMHFMGNLTIDLEGDSAETELYVISHSVDGSGETDRLFVRGIRYLDRLERRDGQWLIVDRYHTLDWTYDTVPSHSREPGTRVARRPGRVGTPAS